MILKRLFCANKEWSTAKNYQIGLVKGTLYRKTQEKGPEPIFRKDFMLDYLQLRCVGDPVNLLRRVIRSYIFQSTNKLESNYFWGNNS